MKKLKTILLLIFIGIFIESSILFYFNNYYLTKKIKITSNSVIKDSDLKKKLFKVPADKLDMKISDSGRYASYIDNGNLIVVNLTTKKQNVIASDSSTKITLFNWLQFEDKLFFIESSLDTAAYKLKVYNSADSSPKLDIALKFATSQKDFNNIVDIKISPGQQGFIMETESKDKLNHLYYITNEYYIEEPAKFNTPISDFIPIDLSNGLILQMSGDNKLHFQSSYPLKSLSENIRNQVDIQSGYSGTLRLDNIKSPKLLGKDGDGDGNVYVGEMNNNKISKFCIVHLFKGTLTPAVYTIDTPVTADKIVITVEGNIYSFSQSAITNLKTKKVSKFSGNFVQVVKNRIYFIKSGWLWSMPI